MWNIPFHPHYQFQQKQSDSGVMASNRQSLKVVTLNCWGLICYNSHKSIRIRAIGDYLASSDYDIVALQELWSSSDFKALKKRLAIALPHSAYLGCWAWGGGLAVFSREEIVALKSHRYSLNSRPYRLGDADWYGRKMVMLATVKHPDRNINVFVTHMISDDSYPAHRIVQSLELARFIRENSIDTELTLVLGDLNMEPTDLGLRVILANSQLKDSWVESPRISFTEKSAGATFYSPSNWFVTEANKLRWPDGRRIDYILFGSKQTLNVKVVDCQTVMGRIASTELNHSDHEGVMAQFQLSPVDHVVSSSTPMPTEWTSMRREFLQLIQSAMTDVTLKLMWLATFLLVVSMANVIATTVCLSLGQPDVIPKLLLAVILLSAGPIAFLTGFLVELNALQTAYEQFESPL